MKTMRILSLVLAALLLVGCAAAFTGCNKTPVVEKQTVDHVYRVTNVKYPDDVDYIENIIHAGDQVIVVAQHYDEKTYQSETKVFHLNMETMTLEPMEFAALENGENEYTQGFIAAADGTFYKAVYSSHSDPETGIWTETYRLYHIAADGTVLFEKEGSEIWGEDTPAEGEYVYHYIGNLMAYGDGVLFTDNNSIWYVNGEGEPAGNIDAAEINENGYINTMMVMDGQLTGLYYNWSTGNGQIQMLPLNVEAGTVGEPVEFLDQEMLQNVYNFFPGAGKYAFFFSNKDGVYGYDSAAGQAQLLLHFLNSDLSSSAVNNLIALTEDRFLSRGWDEVTGQESIMILDRVPDDQVKPKYIMTIAVMGSEYTVRNEVLRFNRQSDEYRFQIKSYSPSDYQDPSMTEYDYMDLVEAALTDLNNDIIAGRIPDVLVVNEYLPVDSYISKGLLTDLYTLMDADSRISREDFLPNILRAYEVNGKLYEISPRFNIMTLAGKTENLGGRTGWTMAEFTEWMKTIPEDAEVFEEILRDDLLQLFVALMYDELVDAETGKCSFDTEDFKLLLEFLATQPTEYENRDAQYDESYWQNYQYRFRDNRVMLMQMALGYFSDLPSMMEYTFYTDEISLVGVPSSDRNGAVIQSDMGFAISAKTPLMEGAWEFVSYFLTEEYQDNAGYYFPIRVSSLEKMADEAVKRGEEEKASWEEYLKDMETADTDMGYVDGPVVTPETMPAMPRTEAVTEVEETTAEPADITVPEEVLTPEEETEESEESVETDKVAEDKVMVETGGGIIGMPYPGYRDDVERYFMNREMADQILEVIRGADSIARINVSVLNIIREDAAAYFAGNKSLEETVRIIQNRVSTKIAESR